MNIGDKVRLLKQNAEGIITKIMANNIIEVDIDSGFKIPVLASELVLIAREEKIAFHNSATSPALPRAGMPVANIAFASIGIYIALYPTSHSDYDVYVINNTDYKLPFTYSTEVGPVQTQIASGHLEAKQAQKVDLFKTTTLDGLPTLLLQWLCFRKGNGHTLLPAQLKRLKLKPTHFEVKAKAPIINREAHLLQLDGGAETLVSHKTIEAKLNNPTPAPQKLQDVVTKPVAELDLHIEKLCSDSTGMSNRQMLDLQLTSFDKAFEAALVHNLPFITFIHGIGNGTLKAEIQKRLSRSKHVASFQDAAKEKFGYGATLVHLKK